MRFGGRAKRWLVNRSDGIQFSCARTGSSLSAREEPVASGKLRDRLRSGSSRLQTGPIRRRAADYCPSSADACALEALVGAMVPNNPLTSLLGPAEKYTVSGLELRPPPSVRVHRPSIASGLPN